MGQVSLRGLSGTVRLGGFPGEIRVTRERVPRSYRGITDEIPVHVQRDDVTTESGVFLSKQVLIVFEVSLSSFILESLRTHKSLIF